MNRSLPSDVSILDTIVPHLDCTGVFTGPLHGEPDPQAVFSVLQFGALVPPLAPYAGQRRLLPGYRHTAPHNGEALRLPSLTAIGDPEVQADVVERLVDQALAHVENPVVLFSGGVDSGLIAARLKALGKEALLLNYCFGPDDPESRLADAMAQALGMRFHRIHAGIETPTRCLKDPGKVYPFPFADHSTAPTSALARAALPFLPPGSVVLDGTGADGGFGMAAKIAKWRSVLRLPRVVRRMPAGLYRHVWTRTGRVEYQTRLLRRSVTMPLLSSVLAQNALAGILYDDAPAATVHQHLTKWITPWAGDDPARAVVAGDLAMTCANTFAQKSHAIFEAAGVSVVYPFLTTDALVTALSATAWPLDQPKAPLKRALARHVPHDMVYRPKSGFVDPVGSVFHDPAFQDHLRESLEGPIGYALKPAAMLRLLGALKARRPLPAQTLNAAWAVAFTHRWYATRQADAAGKHVGHQTTTRGAASAS